MTSLMVVLYGLYFIAMFVVCSTINENGLYFSKPTENVSGTRLTRSISDSVIECVHSCGVLLDCVIVAFHRANKTCITVTHMTGVSDNVVAFDTDTDQWRVYIVLERWKHYDGTTTPTLQPTQQPVICPDEGWSLYEHSCYQFNPTKATWSDSEAGCSALVPGGHLVTVTNPGEHSFIIDLIPDWTFFYIWVGGTDGRTEGVYEWVTGEDWGPFTVQAPDDLVNEFLELFVETDCVAVTEKLNGEDNTGQLVDYWCETPLFSVCEVEV